MLHLVLIISFTVCFSFVLNHNIIVNDFHTDDKGEAKLAYKISRKHL